MCQELKFNFKVIPFLLCVLGFTVDVFVIIFHEYEESQNEGC